MKYDDGRVYVGKSRTDLNSIVYVKNHRVAYDKQNNLLSQANGTKGVGMGWDVLCSIMATSMMVNTDSISAMAKAFTLGTTVASIMVVSLQTVVKAMEW
jgi:hypothetical protein